MCYTLLFRLHARHTGACEGWQSLPLWNDTNTRLSHTLESAWVRQHLVLPASISNVAGDFGGSHDLSTTRHGRLCNLSGQSILICKIPKTILGTSSTDTCLHCDRSVSQGKAPSTLDTKDSIGGRVTNQKSVYFRRVYDDENEIPACSTSTRRDVAPCQVRNTLRHTDSVLNKAEEAGDCTTIAGSGFQSLWCDLTRDYSIS